MTEQFASAVTHHVAERLVCIHQSACQINARDSDPSVLEHCLVNFFTQSYLCHMDLGAGNVNLRLCDNQKRQQGSATYVLRPARCEPAAKTTNSGGDRDFCLV